MNASAPLAAIDDLAALVEAGWNVHADRPAEVLAALRARAPALGADDTGAAAIGLAEHVALAHLHDAAALESLLEALPPALAEAAATAGPLRKARWVIAALRGGDAQPLPDADRWRALQNLWAMRIAQGRATEVSTELQADLPRALAHPDAAARRGLAATCNNLAVELRTGPRGDAARDALMLALADASLRLWRTAGTWVHEERAHYQLARCHAVLANGADALAHARACASIVEANATQPQADAFERFYVHEALAFAHRAAGDSAQAARERQRMAALASEVDDAGLRPWVDDSLRDYDASTA
jgi:hypothetical protein